MPELGFGAQPVLFGPAVRAPFLFPDFLRARRDRVPKGAERISLAARNAHTRDLAAATFVRAEGLIDRFRGWHRGVRRVSAAGDGVASVLRGKEKENATVVLHTSESRHRHLAVVILM